MGFADINVMRVNLTECQGAQSWNPSDRICRSVAIFVHHIESVVKCHCLACQRFKRVCVCVNCELETLTQFSLQGGTSLWSQAERKRHNRPYARSYIRVTCLACCCLCWAAEVQRNIYTTTDPRLTWRRHAAGAEPGSHELIFLFTALLCMCIVDDPCMFYGWQDITNDRKMCSCPEPPLF